MIKDDYIPKSFENQMANPTSSTEHYLINGDQRTNIGNEARPLGTFEKSSFD